MPVFEYQGRTLTGAPISGELEAKNAEELKLFLRKQRIIISSVKKKQKEINIRFGTGISSVDISRFTRQFATMVEAGLPIVQCLTILAEQTENKYLANVISQVKADVSGGSTLSSALAKHKKVFDDLYVNMVEAGEAGGALEVILKRLAEFREKMDSIRRKIKGAMAYPTAIFAFTILITWAMLTFIIPVFAGMFEGLGAELPKPTLIVLGISSFFRHNAILIVLFVVGIILGFSGLQRTRQGRWWIDSAKLKLPVFGPLIRKTAIARFTRTLATLLSSGVNLIDALNITSKTAGNVVLQKAIHGSMVSISEGETITAPLRESKVFPPMVVQMIAVGEQTGNLDDMLTRIADFYDEEVDAAVTTLMSLIEPITIVVLGGIVGALLIAMYLPMFDIIGQIKA
ncbi:type II secretion system F family protein [bacterium]|nr:type II secretion system F family protein [bacterium]